MQVPPHPHIGLQTVSWLFGGTVEHRDSLGTHALVKPGELNLMTAGRGISHSEISTDDTTVLHGVQLWLALPEARRDAAPAFAHYAPPVVHGGGWDALVFFGSLLGSTSPVETFTPLVGAELILDGGTRLSPEIDPAFEHGVLVDDGAVVLGSGLVGRARIGAAELGYLPPGVRTISVAAPDGPARLILLGGEPLGEQIVMWWNFVGRDHDEIVEFRAAWQAELTGRSAATGPPRFGPVPGYPGLALPAPVMPGGRLRPRL
jgi:redox-sensitive bicupin YhaK (pirin superfamily)